MQLDLSEKEIETISECVLFVILYIDQYDNDKAKQLKNNSEKIYAKMVEIRAKKDHKNEN
ncbi:hypothetical protein [Succinivibrio sp.]|uniref:hypothetical protein n=1 Tax=Succinivibrio sp. TaxID=2053619 RepID=UPI003866768E